MHKDDFGEWCIGNPRHELDAADLHECRDNAIESLLLAWRDLTERQRAALPKLRAAVRELELSHQDVKEL